VSSAELTPHLELLAPDELEPAAALVRRYAAACATRLPSRPEVVPTAEHLTALVHEA
jgi:hypothetical protein